MARCPFGTDCFAERARGSAARADVVVTNHALLAIDAIADSAVLPEHQLLVVDEAHDLVDRVTAVATGELTSTALGIASRRIARLVEPELMQRWERASANFTMAIQNATAGRIDHLDDELATHLTALRDAASAARSVIDKAAADTKAAAARAEAVASLTEIGDTASRMLTSFAPTIPDRTDVVWLDQEDNRGSTRAVLRVAPLSVAGLLRDRLFAGATAVLTSATLTVGGSFDAMATAWGLADAPDDTEKHWRGIDVGSPFQHAKAGILYVAAHLPPPGRDGTGSAEQLSEIADLITAAGGRTLGLFSSMRAARAAAEAMAERLSTPVLCQGDDSTAALVEQFAADAATSLFGTLSLWQGVDVPGPSLSLVIIDRIPFPRPDDPLLAPGSARWPPAAATDSWPSPPATPRCCLRRAPGGYCAASTTAGWSRCWTPGWPPPATAATCAPPCRRSGRRLMPLPYELLLLGCEPRPTLVREDRDEEICTSGTCYRRADLRPAGSRRSHRGTRHEGQHPDTTDALRDRLR